MTPLLSASAISPDKNGLPDPDSFIVVSLTWLTSDGSYAADRGANSIGRCLILADFRSHQTRVEWNPDRSVLVCRIRGRRTFRSRCPQDPDRQSRQRVERRVGDEAVK